MSPKKPHSAPTTFVERLLQIHVAALATMGAVILGFGQRNPLLPVMALFAAVTSIVFSDILGWFRLHRHVANVAALIAVVVCSNDFLVGFMRGVSDHQLLAIANLLLCLQFVLLYQKKNVRLYWQLIVLSLLQVVVAAALNLGIQFGALLVVYMVLAVGAMKLAFMHYEMLRLETARNSIASLEWKTRTTRGKNGRGGSVLHWSCDAPPVAFQIVEQEAVFRGFFGWAMVRRIAAICVATLGITVVVFLVTPRTGRTQWRSGGLSPYSIIAYSEEISLGDVGPALESPRIVLRARFVDNETNKPLAIIGDPYLRGAALTNFEERRGDVLWTQSRRFPRKRLKRLPKPSPSDTVVRQEIVAQANGRSVLFGIYPPLALEQTGDDVRFDADQRKLVRITPSLFADAHPFRYVLGANSIRNNRQQILTPADDSETNDPALLELDSDWFPGLTRLAGEIVSKKGIAPDDHFAIANALEIHFLDPELYVYTIDQQNVPRRPAGMNPIEHFVTNHRSGHCEYFASALALMLRSRGIPSRIVVGYHGGEFNSIGKYYQVRDLHAHAWVEALLTADQVPDHLKDSFSGPGPAWLRLDSTPSGRRLASQKSGVAARASDTLDYMETLWYDYVLGLDSDQQRRAIYDPFTTSLGGLFTQTVDDRAWSEFFDETTRSFGVDTSLWWGSRWIDWSALLVICLSGGAVATIVSVFRLPTRLKIHLGRRGAARRGRSSPRREIEFHRRLERLLARFDFRREATQTFREFAREVEVWLGPDGSSAPLNELASTYYRVRFGGDDLARNELEGVNSALASLEKALQRRRTQLTTE